MVVDAFKKMRTNNMGRIAVVNKANPKKIVGVLTKTDLMHILSDKL